MTYQSTIEHAAFLLLWAVSTGGRLLGYCVDEAEVEVIQAALQRSADDS